MRLGASFEFISTLIVERWWLYAFLVNGNKQPHSLPHCLSILPSHPDSIPPLLSYSFFTPIFTSLNPIFTFTSSLPSSFPRYLRAHVLLLIFLFLITTALNFSVLRLCWPPSL